MLGPGACNSVIGKRTGSFGLNHENVSHAAARPACFGDAPAPPMPERSRSAGIKNAAMRRKQKSDRTAQRVKHILQKGLANGEPRIPCPLPAPYTPALQASLCVATFILCGGPRGARCAVCGCVRATCSGG